jgi:hypothetical protein
MEADANTVKLSRVDKKANGRVQHNLEHKA